MKEVSPVKIILTVLAGFFVFVFAVSDIRAAGVGSVGGFSNTQGLTKKDSCKKTAKERSEKRLERLRLTLEKSKLPIETYAAMTLKEALRLEKEIASCDGKENQSNSATGDCNIATLESERAKAQKSYEHALEMQAFFQKRSAAMHKPTQAELDAAEADLVAVRQRNSAYWQNDRSANPAGWSADPGREGVWQLNREKTAEEMKMDEERAAKALTVSQLRTTDWTAVSKKQKKERREAKQAVDAAKKRVQQVQSAIDYCASVSSVESEQD